MNTKDNQRTKITKRLFRESLIKLLEKNSLSEITVSQLCNEAELNRSTFYKYYGNIRDIYEEIEHSVIEASTNCISKVNVHDEDSIIRRIEELLLHINEHSDIYRLLLNNGAYGEFPYKLIEGTVDSIASTHRLSPDSAQKYAGYCSLFMVTGSFSVIRQWLNNGMKESAHELAELLFNIAMGKIYFRI